MVRAIATPSAVPQRKREGSAANGTPPSAEGRPPAAPARGVSRKRATSAASSLPR
jgi:hypothetical protein